MVYTLGQVFVDDQMFQQVPYKMEMLGNTSSWFYENETDTLFIHFPQDSSGNEYILAEHTIEITNQRRLFAPHRRRLQNIHVDGFLFERCGNNYPVDFWLVQKNQQAGAVGTRSGKSWTIINNIVRFANTVAIDFGNEGMAGIDLETGSNGINLGAMGHRIENNYITDNGAAGTAAFYARNFRFIGNFVERNNNLRFSGHKRFESAGAKIVGPSGSIIIDNLFRNNYCDGLWVDGGAGQGSVFTRNLFINNSESGLAFEIGNNESGLVSANIFYGNSNSILLSNAGGVMISHNVFLQSVNADILKTEKTRPDRWYVPPCTQNSSVYNIALFMHRICISLIYLKLLSLVQIYEFSESHFSESSCHTFPSLLLSSPLLVSNPAQY